MSAFTDFWGVFAAAVIADPTLNRAGAVDLLQDVAAVTNQEGNDWFDAVAAFYESIGVINNATYSALRNEIVNEGNGTSQVLFAAIEDKITELPESALVAKQFSTKDLENKIAQVEADIVTVTAHRDAQVDQAIIDALDTGLKRMNNRLSNLQSQLDADDS